MLAKASQELSKYQPIQQLHWCFLEICRKGSSDCISCIIRSCINFRRLKAGLLSRLTVKFEGRVIDFIALSVLNCHTQI